MEILFEITDQHLPAGSEWQDLGLPFPSDRSARLAAAGLSNREVDIRIVQGTIDAVGAYQWLRASGPSTVPAGELGPGLLSEVGFPRAKLQVRNQSGGVATVSATVCGGGQ